MRYYLQSVKLTGDKVERSIRMFPGEPIRPEIVKGEVAFCGERYTGKVEFTEILTLQGLTEAIEKTPFSYFS